MQKSVLGISVVNAFNQATMARCRSCVDELAMLIARTILTEEYRRPVFDALVGSAQTLGITEYQNVIHAALALMQKDPALVARKLNVDLSALDGVVVGTRRAFHQTILEMFAEARTQKGLIILADLAGKTILYKHADKRHIIRKLKTGADALSFGNDDRIIAAAIAIASDEHLIADVFGVSVDHVRRIYDDVLSSPSKNIVAQVAGDPTSFPHITSGSLGSTSQTTPV